MVSARLLPVLFWSIMCRQVCACAAVCLRCTHLGKLVVSILLLKQSSVLLQYAATAAVVSHVHVNVTGYTYRCIASTYLTTTGLHTHRI
jgi:hypothetical protein